MSSLTNSSPSAGLQRAMVQRRSLQTLDDELQERRRQAGLNVGSPHREPANHQSFCSDADAELTEAVEADAEEWKQVNEKHVEDVEACGSI